LRHVIDAASPRTIVNRLWTLATRPESAQLFFNIDSAFPHPNPNKLLKDQVNWAHVTS